MIASLFRLSGFAVISLALSVDRVEIRLHLWLLEISIFLPFEKVFIEFPREGKGRPISITFWKIGGEGRRKNINCERYVCVRRMIERRDIYLFLSLSLILCFSKLDGEIIVETCHQSSSRISFVETWKHCFVLVRGHRTNRNDRRK